MLQKGIIEEVLDKYRVRVRVPRYDKVQSAIDGTNTSDLAVAIIGTLPGINISYYVNDVVLVSYENNELARPVVLGLLYRNVDTSNQINIPRIDSSIKQIDEKINGVNTNFNTFIRYSNSNGKSFTSLYDLSNVSDVFDGVHRYYYCEDMSIDNKSSIIYWSILDENGIDVTPNYSIETIIKGKFYHTDVVEEFSTKDTLIEIPVNFQGLDELSISFKILRTKGIEKCSFILTTDKEEIGTIPGSYIGLSVTTDKTSPSMTSAFAWMSVNDTTNALLKSLYSIISIQRDKNTDKVNGIGIFLDKEEEIEENTVKINGQLDSGIKFITTNPDKPNPYGVKICILKEKPEKMYSGWLYLIEDGDTPGPGPTPTPVEDGLYYIVKDE